MSVWSQFKFMTSVTIFVLELCYNLSFWVFLFFQILVIEFCHSFSFLVFFFFSQFKIKFFQNIVFNCIRFWEKKKSCFVKFRLFLVLLHFIYLFLLSKLEFFYFCHILSFKVWSHFEFLSFDNYYFLNFFFLIF